MIQNSKFKIQNYRSGFTLIELMVAMAIIGILAATAIVNFGKNEDRDVRQEKDRLTSFLREVQNKSLTGDKAGITLGANEKICGYGAYFDSGNLQAFYTSVSGADADCSTASKVHGAGNKLDKFIPRNGVTITTFEDVFFSSPTGDIYVAGLKPTTDLTISMSNSVSMTITPGGIIK